MKDSCAGIFAPLSLKRPTSLVMWHPFGCEYSLLDRWSRLQRGYIRTFGVVDLPSRLRARFVTRMLRSFQWRNMLDLGCGTGSYTFYCSRGRDTAAWGIDINTSRIAECDAAARRLNRDNLKFLAGSADSRTAAFDSCSMDLVLAIESLQCFPDQKQALIEILRILKPGGRFVGHVPALGYLREHETFLFDDRNLPGLLRDAGFEVVSITATFGPAVNLLCSLFDSFSRRQVLTALTFPLLLLASLPLSIYSPRGEYRLFLARKPLS
jgi:SAM-dependent methyltransferase